MNLVIILGEILNIEYKIIDKGKVYAIAFSEIKIEMAKWIRNQYDKMLTYDNLMKAHKLSKRGKGLRKEIILFSLKEEEYIQYLYEKLKSGTYVHGRYSSFKVYEPKERVIEKAPYIDRIVHRWIVDNFLLPYYIPSFIETTYACIKDRRTS